MQVGKQKPKHPCLWWYPDQRSADHSFTPSWLSVDAWVDVLDFRYDTSVFYFEPGVGPRGPFWYSAFWKPPMRVYWLLELIQTPEGKYQMELMLWSTLVIGRFKRPGPSGMWDSTWSCIHDIFNLFFEQSNFAHEVPGTWACPLVNVRGLAWSQALDVGLPVPWPRKLQMGYPPIDDWEWWLDRPVSPF